jgi:hypothetical protein
LCIQIKIMISFKLCGLRGLYVVTLNLINWMSQRFYLIFWIIIYNSLNILRGHRRIIIEFMELGPVFTYVNFFVIDWIFMINLVFTCSIFTNINSRKSCIIFLIDFIDRFICWLCNLVFITFLDNWICSSWISNLHHLTTLFTLF